MMRGFKRKDGVLVGRFDKAEVGMLANLVEQLLDLLTTDEVDGPVFRPTTGEHDPFTAWEADFAHVASDDDGGEADPAMERLFPDAYRDDAGASAEFRRFTRADQLGQKITRAEQVLADLTVARGPVSIADANVGAWLTTLTNLRLTLAVRLGIEASEDSEMLANLPDDDPRGWIHGVYEWLGWVQESLLEAL
ncbi:MAG TPA: DUF2017 family protein [Propionibacteriaceae bacterium]|nr:DUF2017 family protein [Propionibacteriaceae bacterium]